MSYIPEIANPPRPTTVSALLFRDIIVPGDTAIDATAGNGHDTLFLAEAVGPEGRVLAFDVQEVAIASARARIGAAGYAGRVEFFQKSHAVMAEHAAEGSVAAVVFNLGYLPGADHTVATGDDTLTALETAARLIKNGGALSVVCYPGHEGGEDEAAEVEAWMISLTDHRWRVVKYGSIGTIRPAPALLFAVKGG